MSEENELLLSKYKLYFVLVFKSLNTNICV